MTEVNKNELEKVKFDVFIFRQVNIGGLHTKIGTSRNKGISYNSLKISSQHQINFNWKQTVKKIYTLNMVLQKLPTKT